MMLMNQIKVKRYNAASMAGRIVLFAVLLLAVIALNGCRRHDDYYDPLPAYYTEITSDVYADGDIGLATDYSYTVTSAVDTGSILAGVDPVTGEEYRGFLDFPLGGADGIPLDAVIESATLEVYITGMSDSLPGEYFPFLIDLVDFQPPYLIEGDYSRVIQPPLLTMPVNFYPSDEGRFVTIDVTALVAEAQFQELPDLQLRFLLDFSVDSGLIEIDDDNTATAPMLKVTYY